MAQSGSSDPQLSLLGGERAPTRRKKSSRSSKSKSSESAGSAAEKPARKRRAAKSQTGARNPLQASVTSLPGIGPTGAKHFAERAIETVEDLLWFVPKRYDDARLQVPLGEVAEHARQRDADSVRVTCGGQVLSSRFHRRGRKRWLDVRLGDVEVPAPGKQASQIILRWFNAHASMAERYARGTRMVVSGRVQKRGLHAELINPDVLSLTTRAGVTTQAKNPIIPRYTEVAGVPAAKVRKACNAASRLPALADPTCSALPDTLAEELSMVPFAEAMRIVHAPPASLSVDAVRALCAHTSRWHKRLAFEDLFLMGLVVGLRRRARRADIAHACPRPADLLDQVHSVLPFTLTGAQRRAVDLISDDLARPVPMNRLLQGDVGSGKTAVAFAAAYQAIADGRQVAFMAPTEILAEQHFGTLSRWCAPLGIQCALLTASTRAAGRRSVQNALESGYLQLVVGTHALLSESLSFAGLGLVIIDEQHRFGVAQRVELRSKGGDEAHPGVPHLLVMTATPIPRTLALTAYGDLDAAIIDEMPPGRVPPTTQVLTGPQGRARAHALVRARLQAGESVFVVCPSIEPSEDSARGDRADAVGTAERLAHSFAPHRVGLVHGRIAQAERDAVMERFRAGELDILVATTVIEVGVDVPRATVMVILDAHLFGLAQLHQLRGRVGRGGGDSHCLLMTRGTLTADAERRLAVMAETTDGFRIAEEDLDIRGPGELLGSRQAGLPKLRFGDLRTHAALLSQARAAAERFLDSDPELSRPEHEGTRRALMQRARTAGIYGPESG